MKKYIYCCLFIVLFGNAANAQQHVYVHFIPKVSGNTLVAGATVQDLAGVEMSIDFFNYYISNLHLIYDGGLDMDLSDTVFLIKMDLNRLDLGVLNVSTISQVNFGVGVPYALNHLDISKYPLEHPLSFQSPSMQWGWTSGYAHMIVDGKGDSNGDGVPDASFQLHNFGDLNYKNVLLPTVATQTNASTLDIYIYCNVDEWIFGNDPGSVGIIHGSTGINTNVMNNVENRTVFQSPSNAAIETNDILKGVLTSFNSENSVKVSWAELTNASSFSLVDSNGKLIETSTMENKHGEVTFSNISNGVYIFTAYSSTGDKLNQLRIVK